MKKLLLLTMVVIGILVIGCAYKGWVRTDGTEVTYSNFRKANWECYSSIKPGLQMIPIFGIFYNMAVQQEEKKQYEKCMEEKGFYKK